MKAIDKSNIHHVSAYLEKFSDWVKDWNKEYPDFGLSSPTFQALIQTVTATQELCTYLLDNVDGIEYVLLGFLQQDYLEGRFGWYRQLSGGNYYCSVLQFLQAEKTIRLRSLVKSGYNMKEIANMFASAENGRNTLLKGQATQFADLFSDFTFCKPSSDDAPITYYVAGYVTRGMVKKSSCESCQSILSDKMQPLSIDIENDENMVSDDTWTPILTCKYRSPWMTA